MLGGALLGAALVIAVVMLCRAGGSDLGRPGPLFGFAVVGLVIAISVAVIAARVADTVSASPPPTAESRPSWLAAGTASSSFSGIPPASASSMRVGSVESMLDGLRSRLESEPADPSGWALLAQSYAFVGEFELAESAGDRAVEYGFDADEIARRIEASRQNPDPHAGLDIGWAR